MPSDMVTPWAGCNDPDLPDMIIIEYPPGWGKKQTTRLHPGDTRGAPFARARPVRGAPKATHPAIDRAPTRLPPTSRTVCSAHPW